MTREQAQRIAEHGPYKLRSDGVLIDRNGVGILDFGVVCKLDRAIVAALNQIASDLAVKS